MPGDRGLIQDVRPASAEVTGQQRELFAFDAFEYEDPNKNDPAKITVKEGWKLNLQRAVIGDTDLSVDGSFLNVDLIEAGSITANEIDVNGLFAEEITVTGSIQSENYVPDTTGWKITSTSIEIDDGIFRGNLDVAGGTITGAEINGGEIEGAIIRSIVPGEESVIITDGGIRFGSGNVFNRAELSWSTSPSEFELFVGISAFRFVGRTIVPVDNVLFSPQEPAFAALTSLGSKVGNNPRAWGELVLQSNILDSTGLSIRAYRFPSTMSQNLVYEHIHLVVKESISSCIGSFGSNYITHVEYTGSNTYRFRQGGTTLLNFQKDNFNQIGTNCTVLVLEVP